MALCCLPRQRPPDWPTSAGLLNYIDGGEKRKVGAVVGRVQFAATKGMTCGVCMVRLMRMMQVMTYALDGGRLTWNVAVPWAPADLDQLQNRRYITDDSDAKVNPRSKLDRSVIQQACGQSLGSPTGFPVAAWQALMIPPSHMCWLLVWYTTSLCCITVTACVGPVAGCADPSCWCVHTASVCSLKLNC